MAKKALVVGFGSIGKKHAQILTSLGLQVSIVTKQNILQFESFNSLGEIKHLEVFDYIVISTETSKHSEILNNLLERSFDGKVLIEKPLNSPGKLINNGLEIFVGYNLRFLSSLSVLRKYISGKKIILVDSYCGSHLKSWRKENSDSYSNYRSQGGGVLMDLSHEIDYVSWIFGNLELINASGGRFSNITHDSDDAWNIICKTVEVPMISIRLNYLDHLNTRQIRVVTESETYLVDLLTNEIYSSSGNAYQGEDKIADTYSKMHSEILFSDKVEIATTASQALLVDDFIATCLSRELKI